MSQVHDICARAAAGRSLAIKICHATANYHNYQISFMNRTYTILFSLLSGVSLSVIHTIFRRASVVFAKAIASCS